MLSAPPSPVARNRGAVTVEFVFTFVFFLFFLLAATSYGLGVVAEQILGFQATRQAERAVVVDTDDSGSAADEYAKRLCSFYTPANVPLDSGFALQFAPVRKRRVSLTPNEQGSGGTLQVELTAGFSLLEESPIDFLPLIKGITVRGTAQVSGNIGVNQECSA